MQTSFDHTSLININMMLTAVLRDKNPDLLQMVTSRNMELISQRHSVML